MALLSLILPFLVLIASPIQGKKYHDKYDHYYEYPPRQNYYDMAEKYRRYDHSEPAAAPAAAPAATPFHQKTHTFIADYGPTPPPHDQVAKMARYIVHNADWAAVATHSSSPSIRGFPFANVVSISDGTVSNSSGVPYMYITPLELSTRDLEIDSRCSLALSLAETDYCKQQNIDPEDPRCARVILTGKIKKVNPHTTEIDYAENALFSRHPSMRSWPKNHGFYFAKMKIEQILVLDFYGGPKIVTKAEYFNPGEARYRA